MKGKDNDTPFFIVIVLVRIHVVNNIYFISVCAACCTRLRVHTKERKRQ